MQALLDPPSRFKVAYHEPEITGRIGSGLIELVQREEGSAEDACIDRNDRQKGLKSTHASLPGQR
jgi:hypothetical protein